jgi:hypothetical protein
MHFRPAIDAIEHPAMKRLRITSTRGLGLFSIMLDCHSLLTARIDQMLNKLIQVLG